MTGTIAVIGAGWSGLAAAIELRAAGREVALFEAARVPGGRARGLHIDGHALDNGQHLFIGAYRRTFALMERVGLDPAQAFVRRRFELCMSGDGDRIHLRMPPGPTRTALALGLATARGIGLGDRLRALAGGHRLLQPPVQDTDVRTWLQHCAQSAALRRAVWEPLCLAALNTPAEQASARVFARVLGDTFASRGGADLMLARPDLGTLFPVPAVAWLRSTGTAVHLGSRIRSLERTAAGDWHLHTGKGVHEAGNVVLATDAPAAARLLAGLPACNGLAQRLTALGSAPITTVWLRFPPTLRLEPPMTGRLDGPAQWLFDRATSGHPGIIAAVISGAGAHMDMDRDTLAARVIAQLADLARTHGAPAVLGVVRERRATHCCTPETENLRPQAAGPLPGLWLAGDHVANGLPATIEGAVHNGGDCARLILAGDGGHGIEAANRAKSAPVHREQGM